MNIWQLARDLTWQGHSLRTALEMLAAEHDDKAAAEFLKRYR